MNTKIKIAWYLGRKLGCFFSLYRKKLQKSLAKEFISSFAYYYNNRFYDFEGNGEKNVIKKIHELNPRVVFDVGAHLGEYSKTILSYYPDAEVHAFEINPKNSRKVSPKILKNRKIHWNNVGLSEENKTLVITQYNQAGDISSIHPVVTTEKKIFSKDTVEVTTGYIYMQKNSISKIDFLKVDTEGNDLAVLKGFGSNLDPSIIKIIQFEYNELSISARVFLKDFYDLLLPLGYRIGQVFPTGVEFKSYSTLDEIHRGSNWVACSLRPDINNTLKSLSLK